VTDDEVFPKPLLIFRTYTVDVAEPFVTLVADHREHEVGPSPLA